MTRGTVILSIASSAVLALAGWAGAKGVGIPNPDREPPSIRAGSTRPAAGGAVRTRYFTGGGIHSGK